MSWFKVDDQFPEHRKVRRLGKDRTAAVGLWTLCGAWASAHSDGFVPDEIVTRYDPEHVLATRLCEVGLWCVAQVEGEQGYEFHDWLEYRSSREQEQKKRDDTRRRVQAHRGRKRAEQAKRAADGTYEAAEDDGDPTDAPASNTTGNALLGNAGNASGNPAPDPTRPVPVTVETYEDPSLSGGGSGGKAPRKRSADPTGHRLPEDWQPTDDDRAWFLENCPDLRGRGRELTDEFRDYWLSKAGKDARKVDWSRTWRNRMRDRQERQGSPNSAGGRRRPTATSEARIAAVQSLKRPDPGGDSVDTPPQLQLASGGF